MTKMTKKDWYNVLRGIVEATEVDRKDDIISFLDHEIELLDRKSSKSTLTKTQKENTEVIEKIYDTLVEIAKPVTITELMEDEAIATYTLKDGNHLSNQKVSALMKKLVDSERVVKKVEKKKAYFSVA
jgi:hypothetical protein